MPLFVHTIVQNKMSSNSMLNVWNDVAEGESSYTRLCVSALLAALFGLGSFLVYFTPWLFFVGGFAILLSIFALWTIRSAEGTLMGTSLAYFGLCCAIVALVSIAVFWAVYQYGIRREADQFFRLWFAAVQQGNIPQAKEYQSTYAERSHTADAEEWWKNQYKETYAHHAVHKYVEDKLVRVLMALRDDAKVSYYKTLHIVSDRESDIVVAIYAVTFPAASGETETFFFFFAGKRSYPSKGMFKTAGWNIEGTPAFHLPDEFNPGKR
jgi:hypothetical protein